MEPGIQPPYEAPTAGAEPVWPPLQLMWEYGFKLSRPSQQTLPLADQPVLFMSLAA